MRILLALFLVFNCAILFGQKINDSYQLRLKPAFAPILVDGILDEEPWVQAEVATDFYMVLPMDTQGGSDRSSDDLCDNTF